VEAIVKAYITFPVICVEDELFFPVLSPLWHSQLIQTNSLRACCSLLYISQQHSRFAICRLEIPAINLCAKSEASISIISTTYEDIKSNAKCRKWGRGSWE